MNISQLKKVLPVLLKHKIPPFLWGPAGVGKTQVVRQLAKELGIGFVPLYLGTQSDMGDIIGLLKHNQDGTVSHARPEWMPTEGQGIIFLDEFNRAHPDVLQGMYSFLIDGTIHNHRLPPGWAIIAAGNYQNNNYTVTDMSDNALISRLCHIDVKPSPEEFIAYAETMNAATVAAFIRDQPALIGDDAKQALDTNMVKPNRRAWLDMIGRLETEDFGDLTHEVYSGCVGLSAAAAFITHKRKLEKSISISQVLEKYDKIKPKILDMSKSGKKESARFDLLNTALAELAVKLESNPNFLTETKLANLKEFLLDIPVELALKAFEDFKKRNFKGKEQILNDIDFVKAFRNNIKENKVA